MSSEQPVPGRREAWTTLPLDAVVPPRAVLTELARGFLMVHEVNPESARRFAQTFLKEQAGTPPVPPKVVPAERLASVRRGVVAALRERGSPPFES
ncbi:MAG: hypothetical protein L3K01_03975 [Thermoplasmata archaeon]|nr:hypothetical protein [Thermoplasmata archaeon]MCI4332873.1 hypothetical protein [Thermoplasmata archaeon]